MYEELEKYAEFKKVALRFIKELGLYSKWIEYLQKNGQVKTWYKKVYIDNIFGHTSFTSYIDNRDVMKYNELISVMFRSYIAQIKRYDLELQLTANVDNIRVDKDTRIVQII